LDKVTTIVLIGLYYSDGVEQGSDLGHASVKAASAISGGIAERFYCINGNSRWKKLQIQPRQENFPAPDSWHATPLDVSF